MDSGIESKRWLSRDRACNETRSIANPGDNGADSLDVRLVDGDEGRVHAHGDGGQVEVVE